MPTTKTIQIPERLRVVVTLAQLLERLEVGVPDAGADQYRSVVAHLVDEIGHLEGDESFELVLSMFPATAELYENLRYQQAGLCRSPLELSLDTELQARALIDRARRRAA